MTDETPRLAGGPNGDAGPASEAARHAGGFTLDLSTGRAVSGKRPRKGQPALVQQTINLSTRKAEPPQTPSSEKLSAEAASPRPTSGKAAPLGAQAQRGEGKGGRRDKRRADAGSGGIGTLAELLDAETLARLHGR